MNDAPSAGDVIVAIVTTEPERIRGGGVPVFVAPDEGRLERTATLLAKMTRGMVHDLEGGTYVIVRH